jgi:hypothetical protein
LIECELSKLGIKDPYVGAFFGRVLFLPIHRVLMGFPPFTSHAFHNISPSHCMQAAIGCNRLLTPPPPYRTPPTLADTRAKQNAAFVARP